MNKYFQILVLLLITVNTVAMNKKNKSVPSKTHTTKKTSTTKKIGDRSGFTKAEREYFADVPDLITTDDVTLIQGPILPHPNFAKANVYEIQLIDATIAKNLPMVKDAIENHNVNVNAAPFQGVTALHLACNEGLMDIIKYLLSKNADINAKDHEGYTPLDYTYYPKVVEYLKKKGAKSTIEKTGQNTKD